MCVQVHIYVQVHVFMYMQKLEENLGCCSLAPFAIVGTRSLIGL